MSTNSNQNWDDIGRNIQEIIDRAVNSQDFQKLNQTVSQVVDRANQASSRTNRPGPVEYTPKNPQRTQYTSPVRKPSRTNPSNSNLPAVYGYTGSKTTVGLLKTIGGGGITFISGLGMLGSLLAAAFFSDGGMFSTALYFAAATLGGSLLLRSGVTTLTRLGRFKSYIRIIGQKTYCDLEQLSRGIKKPVKFVKRDLNRLIHDGLFLEGHLDHESNCLITTNETYRYYQECRKTLENSKKEEIPVSPSNPPAPKANSEVQDVLDKGEAFLRQIHKSNLDIPGEEITKKISHMELLIARIFERVENHPEVVPDLKKLMDYYLPMTVKLLGAYAEMDRQPIQGENILSSKQEIEKTLDTLNLAFEKLLDSIFKETAIDVSSDISVLHTLLAQEGLTEDEFSKLKKENKYNP